MSATKRKFNALLNGIGNKTTTTTSPSSASSLQEVYKNGNRSQVDLTSDDVGESHSESQTKKPRLSHSSSIRSQASSVQNSVRRLGVATFKSALQTNSALDVNSSANVNPTKPASLPSSGLATELPKYAPWDRKAFLQRLKSFSSILDWMSKPDIVNEVEWAKRGWVCQGNERVRCCLCNVEVCVKLNRKEVDGEEKLIVGSWLIGRYIAHIILVHGWLTTL